MISKYLLVWFLLAFVAIANGMMRQYTYGRVLPELTAHQISTGTAILACTMLVWVVNRLWPIPAARQAWLIGACWLIMTVLFEFGFGHFVAGHSWTSLFADYNIFEGRLWSLFLIWITILPYGIFKFRSTSP